jgi:Fic family protein
LVLKALQAGANQIDRVSKETGVALPIVRAVKRRALKEGLITLPKRPDRQEKAASPRERGEKRRRASIARDLEILRERGPLTRQGFQAFAKCSDSSATRRLRRLVQKELAVRERLVGDGRTVTYTAK